MKKRGQISIEYITIIGFVFIILSSLLVYGFSEVNKSIAFVQSQDSVKSIIAGIDKIHSLGTGSQDFVWITLPGSIESFSINRKSLSLKYSIGSKVSDIHFKSNAMINGTLPQTRGTYRIAIQSINNTHVNLYQK